MMDAEGTVGTPVGPHSQRTTEHYLANGSNGEGLGTHRLPHTVEYTEEGVVEMVRCLNSSDACPQGAPTKPTADEYLTEFQRHPSAWSICISILNKHAAPQKPHYGSAVQSAPTELLHFAAQTLAAQARAGFPQQLSALLGNQRAAGGSMVVSDDSAVAASRVYAELRDGLLQLVFAFRDAPRPVLRQLCIALSSAIHFGAVGGDGSTGSGGPYLEPVLESLGRQAGTEGFLPLLELLTLIPEELCTKRNALPEDQRVPCLARCICNNTVDVLKAVESMFLQAKAAHDKAAPQERPHWLSILHAAVKTLQSWLAAICCWMQLLEGEQGPAHGARGMEDALEVLSLALHHVAEGQMFGVVLRGVTSEGLDTLQLSSECVVSVTAAASLLEDTTKGSKVDCPQNIMGLSQVNGSSGSTLPGDDRKDEGSVSPALISSIVKAYGDGCNTALAAAKAQPRGIAAFDAERLQLFAQGLLELAKTQIPRLLVSIAEGEAWLEDGGSAGRPATHTAETRFLQPYIESICELSRALLHHPSYEVKEVAVAFFRNLLNDIMGLMEEERRLASWRDHLRDEAAAAAAGSADTTANARNIEESLSDIECRYTRIMDALAFREPVLSRLFRPLTEAAVQELKPPLLALMREEIEYDTWQSFRTELATTVTEAAVLLDLERACNAAAAQLISLLKDPQESYISHRIAPLLAVGTLDSWLEIEARLFFVTTIANRIHLSITDSTERDSKGVFETGTAYTDPERNSFVLQLFQGLPQLRFPAEPRQSSAVYTQATDNEVASLFLHAAVARATAWLAASVVPQHQEMFAPLFSLLVSRSLQFVASLPDAPKDSNVHLLRNATEALLVEGVSSLVAAASAFIPSPGREEDSLGEELERSLADPRCATATLKRNLALFFSALQSVQPAQDYCPPPPCQSFEALSPRSPYRHPVLDAVEGSWPTVEKAMTQIQRSEFLYDVTCYGLVALCAQCRSHVPRYRLFYSFLQLLSSTFAESPTVYHLGALRSLQGIFSNSQEACVRRAVATALEGCVGTILQKIKVEGEKYIYSQPDLVGISTDCVNVALLHPLSAQAIVGSAWFKDLTTLVIRCTPTCNHPKVLHTYMVFLSRIAAWTEPPAIVHSFQVGGPIPWLEEASQETSAVIMSLLSLPFPPPCPSKGGGKQPPSSFLAETIAAVILALTSVHAAPQSWIGSAAQTILPLLRHSILEVATKKAIETALQALDVHIMDEHQKREFCWRCTGQLSMREMCALLQQTADDTKASYAFAM
ncbi:hypothetical protein cyc_06986 [Cyclospora cayetanensis]|uniref:Exportin-1/Importin-beta-like domain-containing protein n=1 Tax=Cyclospora cayetanensis TaxID=88456 RepID=A0A1D3CYB9_9EIME|nr:hypothetical protein cyc_06986 [Cyclospora cayetanensis]